MVSPYRRTFLTSSKPPFPSGIITHSHPDILPKRLLKRKAQTHTKRNTQLEAGSSGSACAEKPADHAQPRPSCHRDRTDGSGGGRGDWKPTATGWSPTPDAPSPGRGAGSPAPRRSLLGGLGPDRSDKVDRRFPPCQLRPPGHIPEKPDSRDAEQGAGQAGARRHGRRAGEQSRARTPTRPRPARRLRGGVAAAAPPQVARAPARRRPGAPGRPAPGTWMNWMVSADLPTPPPPTTTSRYFSWPEPSRQPAAAMGTPPSPPGHAEPPPALGPAPGTCAAGGLRASGGRGSRAPGAAGRAAPGGSAAPGLAGSRPRRGEAGGPQGPGAAAAGGRAAPHVSAAPAERCLQRRYKWPSGGRAARLRCCICMRGRGGAGPLWPGLRLQR